MWLLLLHFLLPSTLRWFQFQPLGESRMLKGRMIKGHVSCPPAHIHQRCLAFDAPNLLIFVQGSIKNHSSRPSHLFPFDSLLSCTWCIYYLLWSMCVPCPHLPQLSSPSAHGPSVPLTAELVLTSAQPGHVACRLSCRHALGGVKCPPRAGRTSSALCIKLQQTSFKQCRTLS